MEHMAVELDMEEVASWSSFHSEKRQKGDVVNYRSSTARMPASPQSPLPTSSVCETLRQVAEPQFFSSVN